MYDSLLFGNGLTKAVLASIKDNYPCRFSHYLDCDAFIRGFIDAAPHRRIVREFLRYFSVNSDTLSVHEKVKNFIRSHFDEIASFGFERWVSKNLFSSDREPKEVKFYLYNLYNYWYHVINESILKLAAPARVMTQMGEIVLKGLTKESHIFTTNFDTILDSTLFPDHIHGRFQLPLLDLNDTVAFYINEQEFEWKYLFGTNGYEKYVRLKRISQNQTKGYDLNFFYNDSLNLGDLLIFGLSFGRAEFISDEFLRQYPQHKDFKLARTVDGHILSRLSEKKELNKLNRITISCYKESEVDHYKEMFEDTNLEDIVDYLPSHEIFDF